MGDQRTFFAVVDKLRASGEAKLTESEIDELVEHPLLQHHLGRKTHPRDELEQVAEKAVAYLELQADRILSLYLRCDLTGLRASDRQVLEAVYRLALRQGTRVLASSRYLAILVPNYGYKTIQDRSPKLAERGFFKFFHGNSSTPWQRTNRDSSNVYELPLIPPEPGKHPELPDSLMPLTESEIEALNSFQRASARLKKKMPPRKIKIVPPTLDSMMSLDDIRQFNEELPE